MRSFNIGSLALLTNNVSAPNYILQTPIAGLDSPSYRTNYFSKPGEDGGKVSSLFYDQRPVSLTGVVYANDAQTYETARQALATACAINKNAAGDPVPTLITYTTLAGNSYFFNAYIDRPIFDYTQPNSTNFLITMTVADPFIYGATQVQSGAILAPSGGGFILPVILPIVSTPTTGGTATLTNNGNAKSNPLLTLNGPLTNPFIYNQAIGKSMQLNTTIAGGSSVVIDMANKTIMLNGTTPLLTAKDSLSEWWAMVPGSNPITFNTSSTADTGNLMITFYPAWLGT